MTSDEIIQHILATWRVHNSINLYLLKKIPAKGFEAVPLASRGRTVAEQFAHMNRVRYGWLLTHRTGKFVKSSELPKRKSMPRAQFIAVFKKSGKEIEEHIAKALRGEAKARLFGRNIVRWMGYLISHESHHRGSIMLALKQNGMRQKDDVAINGLWGPWMFGK
ncbi:MAG: hypothetical protein L0Y80_12995 [Ignavibacteriae bacterium]|nr:hypothetical protein [Ignavibacteriota bacterium]